MKSRMVVLTTLIGLAALSLVTLLGADRLAGSRVLAQNSPDPDAVALAVFSRQALAQASQAAADPVLRQVDVDPKTGQVTFRYVNPGATIEVDVDVPSLSSLPDRWQVSTTAFSKLVGFRAPALDMPSLKVGPAAVGRSLAGRWSGCRVGNMTLYMQDEHLTWTGFCTLPDGRIASGSTDNQTGEFQASPAPPAYPPATALPSR